MSKRRPTMDDVLDAGLGRWSESTDAPLLEIERENPLRPHDAGCSCWPHVSQRAAVEAATQAALAEYREGLKRVLPADPRIPLNGDLAIAACLREVERLTRAEAEARADVDGLVALRSAAQSLVDALEYVPGSMLGGKIALCAALLAGDKAEAPLCDYPLSDGRTCTRLSNHVGVHQ